MPVYEYGCEACGRREEVMHGIHGAGPAACPACGGPMRKLVSAPAIHFKGSGWAKVDARAASSARTKAAGASSGSDGASAGAGGGDRSSDAATAGPGDPSSPAPASGPSAPDGGAAVTKPAASATPSASRGPSD